MAKSLEDYSSLLARLSDSLIKDEKFRVKGNDEYRDFRRLFQNSIDCAKYLCPELEILAKFVIPLTPDKLGGLNLVSRKDENYNEDFEAFKNPRNFDVNKIRAHKIPRRGDAKWRRCICMGAEAVQPLYALQNLSKLSPQTAYCRSYC
ncbi:unnamed protein product [Oikopleura dioica]|uniref:Uncharacterized protein n=1 Tax=Oikopleura dioica TaxID=34765 RepID=E4XQN2_OIKDI|nr:unnamed protein product [Oikopleura dioica]